jgi:hypothetical protein
MPRAHGVKAEGRGGALQAVKSSGFNNLIAQTIVPLENPKTNPLCPRRIIMHFIRDNKSFIIMYLTALRLQA